MDMDAGAVDRRQSGKGRIDSKVPTGPRAAGRGRGVPARGNNLNGRQAQAIIRGIAGPQANVLESRITTGGTTLKVDGLKASKAASNADGGLESLLGFLERKSAGLDAASNRAIKIKKVCLLI
jgi:nuclear RNA export factor